MLLAAIINIAMAARYLRQVSVRLVLCCSLLAVSSQHVSADLRGQLLDLADAHGFMVQGLGVVEAEADKAVGGDLHQQLKQILRSYSYIIVEDADGGITKVLILSREMSGGSDFDDTPVVSNVITPGEYYIPTRHRGTHQIVEAVLVGPGQAPLTVSLMVDTGASTVVLPKSMIGQLGFTADELRDGWTQTANGRVRTRMGTLRSIDVGGATVRDVTVTFLDDSRLNGARLLGMSYLQHFRMTIDDANSRIILTSE